MVEEAPKGFLRSIVDKIRDKIGEKAADWIFVAVWPVLIGWAVLARHWLASEWGCINKPWCEVRGWSLGLLIAVAAALAIAAACLSITVYRVRRELREATTRAKSVPAPASLLFHSIEVIDNKLMLRWFIRRPPREWLHWRNIAATVSYTAVHAVLDGPFHAAPGCNAPVKEIGARGLLAETAPTSPTFEETCRNCGQRIFRGPGAPVWPVRDQTLDELQRLERNGTRLEGRDPLDGPVVLENPAYWNLMKPPR